MDAGLAALLGAAVGSIATLGAALVNGRMAGRLQFSQWRRQHRRDAYANYLGALHDRDIAADAVFDALAPERPDLGEVDERVQRFVALAREVHRAAEVVILEGPSSMAEAADDVAHASSDVSGLMRRMVRDARAAESSGRTANAALVESKKDALYQAVKKFRAAAGGVLGNRN